MTPEEALALKEVAYKLIGIATGETATLPLAFPPGTVPVKPTGVRGAGIVRYWPEPKPTEGENAWGYMIRMARTKDASGLYWFPPQLIGSYGLMASAFHPDMPWPEQADRLSHREDWMTQEDLDREAAAAAQWGEWNDRVEGG